MEQSSISSPLVSVIMPAYKQADYIADALESLIRQTYHNWEVAIVDDGSPDNVAEIAKIYCDKDPRIRFYHTDNHGVSGARNFAAANTSGEFIIPLDADDTFEPEYLEKCVAEFRRRPNLKLVYCQWQMFGAKHKSPELQYKGYADLLVVNTIFCSAMYRRTDFNRIGGYDTNIPFGFEDWDFWISLLDADAEVCQLQEKLFNYRIKKRSRNIEVNIEENKKITLQYIYRKHHTAYLEAFPDMIYRLQRLRSFQRHAEKWKRKSFPYRLWHAIKGK